MQRLRTQSCDRQVLLPGMSSQPVGVLCLMWKWFVRWLLYQLKFCLADLESEWCKVSVAIVDDPITCV